jgi:hypothetical protein
LFCHGEVPPPAAAAAAAAAIEFHDEILIS